MHSIDEKFSQSDNRMRSKSPNFTKNSLNTADTCALLPAIKSQLFPVHYQLYICGYQNSTLTMYNC